MPEKKIAECIEGKMQFNIKNVDCDLMNWYRKFAHDNKRSVTQEIILAMEMVKDLNETKIQ